MKKTGKEVNLPGVQDKADLDLDVAVQESDLVEFGFSKSADLELRFRLAALGGNGFDLICELSRDLKFVYASQNWREIFGYEPAGLIGHHFPEFIHPEESDGVAGEMRALMDASGSKRFLFRMRNARGEWCWLDATGKAYFSPTGEVRAVFIARDVTERQQIEEQRALLASRDATTVLFNKSYFVEQLIKAVDAAREGPANAVIYLDLDNFKLINDRCGHLAGDRLIVAVANLLHEAGPPQGLLARFGGDEFLLLMNGVNGMECAMAVAEEIRARLFAYRFLDGDGAYQVSASLGVVMVDGCVNSREVLNRANAACAFAKSLGGNRVEFFRVDGSGRDGFLEE